MNTDVTTAPSAQSPEGGPVTGGSWARYQIGERLGAGGMGTVWAAHDTELDRDVALKVLHDDHLSRESQARLRREAKAMARVTHANVVPVFDVGEHAGRSYYTMELVRGQAIKDWLREPRAWRDVVRVFAEAARGLDAIHAAGFVHRDIKPGNLLLGDDGHARVVDLGIAAPAHPGSTLANASVRAGTPAYMAPEQLAGGDGSVAADQYALGLSLWEALHGRRPFGGDTIETRLEAMRIEPEAARDLPRWLDAAARRMIAVEPADRFPDVGEIARVLAGPARRRWPWLAAAMVVAVAAAVVVVRSGSDDAGTACRADAQLDEVWDATTAARIGVAVAAMPVPYAVSTWREVERTIEDYAASWQAASELACRARIAGEPEATSTRRAACLDQRRAGLRALVVALETPSAESLVAAPRVARELSGVSDCADPSYLASLAAARDPDRTRIREEIAETRLGRAAGRRDLLAVAQRALAEAREVHDPQLEAQALLAVGRAQLDTDQLISAVDTLARAALAAGKAGDVKTKIESWQRSTEVLLRLGRFDEADQLLDLAEAALRTSPDPARESRVVNLRANLLAGEGHFEAAIAKFEQAIALVPPTSLELSNTYLGLADVQRLLGHLPEALAAAEHAKQLDTAVGAHHPDAVADLRVIGVIQSDLGKLDDARASLIAGRAIALEASDHSLAVAMMDDEIAVVAWRRHDAGEAIATLEAGIAIRRALAPDAAETLSDRAKLALMLAQVGRAAEAEPELRAVVDIETRKLGATHPTVLIGHVQLGEVLPILGRLDDAFAELELARAGYERATPPNERMVATTLYDEASIERDRNRFAAALALDDRARVLRERVLPADHPERHAIDLSRALDELGLGHAAVALPLAESAAAYYESAHIDDSRIHAQFTVAQARWLVGKDRRAAVAMARAIRDEIAKLSSSDPRLGEIDAWLARK